MYRFDKELKLIIAGVLSFVTMIFIVAFLWWLLSDRASYADAYPITMYVLIFAAFVAQFVFTLLTYFKAKQIDDKITLKYLWWAFALTPIFVGPWMYWYMIGSHGIVKKKQREAVILYFSTRIDKTLEFVSHKLKPEELKEVKTLIMFKDNGILKKYEANYFIASVLVDSEVIDLDKVKREKLSIIASNII